MHVIRIFLFVSYFAVNFLVEVYCTLRGVKVNNGSTLKCTDFGENEDALICRTSKEDCCKRPRPLGECYDPDGNSVARKMDGEKLYRNRGDQMVRLNSRLFGTSFVEGEYKCCVPDECGNIVCFYFTIGE